MNISEFASNAIQQLQKPYLQAPPVNPNRDTSQLMGLHKNINALGGEYCDYPSLNDSLIRTQFAEILKKEQPLRQNGLSSENILFVSGISGGIDLLFKTMGNVSVAIASPTFDLYQFVARSYGLTSHIVPWFNFENIYDAESIETLTNPQHKLILLCSPNNPTGQVVSHDIIKTILGKMSSSQFLVVDEAYIEFSEQASLANWVVDYPNLIVMRTFSKAWAIAGARIGAMIAGTSIIDALKIAQLPFSIPTPTFEALSAVLQAHQKVIENCQKIIQLREELRVKINAFAWITLPTVSQANFIFIQCKQANQLAEYLMKEKQIMISNQSKIIPDSLRISVGNREQNQRLLNALHEAEDKGVVSKWL